MKGGKTMISKVVLAGILGELGLLIVSYICYKLVLKAYIKIKEFIS